RREDIWPATRQKSNSGPFDISGGSPAKQVQISGDIANRRPGARPLSGAGVGNPSMTLRNLIISPMKRPQLSRNRTQMFSGGLMQSYDIFAIQYSAGVYSHCKLNFSRS
ncbi:E3 ubiquitin-protein ligase ccnb1ip1-like protein, partial [Thalictrum thalictroides]